MTFEKAQLVKYWQTLAVLRGMTASGENLIHTYRLASAGAAPAIHASSGSA
jgi:hypothetical protein